MARKFTDPNRMLGYLLDRLEDGVAAPLAYPDHSRFANITEHDLFVRKMTEAEKTGAVHVEKARGKRTGEVKFVRLADPPALYSLLGRTPSVKKSESDLDAILSVGDFACGLQEEARAATDAWRRNRSWCNVRPGDVDSMRAALLLAQAVLEGRHDGLDYRTFSRRVTGNSKALERLEAAVCRALRGAGVDLPAAAPREALEAAGLGKVSPPLLVSGPVALGGAAVPASMPYVGCNPRSSSEIRFSRPPSFVLTIENYASFVRFAEEADPERSGLAVYVGGYPAAGIQKALADIGSRLLADVPVYHWSDIDPDGVGIFLTVEKAIGRQLRPHLMDVSIAEKHGAVPPQRPSRLPKAEGTLLEGLAAYLAKPSAKHLEQEELDPIVPDWKADGPAC